MFKSAVDSRSGVYQDKTTAPFKSQKTQECNTPWKSVCNWKCHRECRADEVLTALQLCVIEDSCDGAAVWGSLGEGQAAVSWLAVPDKAALRGAWGTRLLPLKWVRTFISMGANRKSATECKLKTVLTKTLIRTMYSEASWPVLCEESLSNTVS